MQMIFSRQSASALAKGEVLGYKRSPMTKSSLPDVAIETSQKNYPPIDWVGMGDIELPLLLKQADGVYRIPSRVEAKVSLDKKAERGIHMSRLFLIVQEILSRKELSFAILGEVTAEFLKTHLELSSRARVKVQFEAPIKRPALKTSNEAWRTYPVTLSVVNHEGQKKNYVEVLVTYSSTCPASAALSRQLIQDNFHNSFQGKNLDYKEIHQWLGSTQGIIATPHAQRSFARVKVQVGEGYDFVKLLDLVEEALQTAVQGAVKREDEQEFALRNGQNLMFCEDAARRVKAALDAQAEILDYVAHFSHVESLHPHNAESFITKGRELQAF
ncbi:GTP cyclohydrolase FolE2 [compost metagenome]